ncbi:MAG: DUF2332 family protein [Alphaproteobacteria bacterium]|nr:DUF2332 family protein [Alphaproteobacteria bacterium]
MTGKPFPPLLTAAFEKQEAACRNLGSPFTSLICGTVARIGLPVSKTRATMVNWDGDPSSAGDALPIRLCGALHELVLTGSDRHLSRLYPPNHEGVTSQTLHAAISSAVHHHDDFLAERLLRAPQTNEVRRSTALIAGLLHIADRTGMPLHLSEIGASAGLNLHFDRFAHRIAGHPYGKSTSSIQLEPDWQGPPPPLAKLVIADRAGCDLSPFDLSRKQEQTRLLSYVWADQHERLERLRTAIALAASRPVRIDRSDALDWLKTRLQTAHEGHARVLFHTIAWQYLPEAAKKEGRDMIEQAGARATRDAPLFLLAMEPDGKSPGAGLRLDAWPDATSKELARVDFHGRWVHWNKDQDM